MSVKTQSSDDPIDRLARQMGKMARDLIRQPSFSSCGTETWEPSLNVYEVPSRWVVCVDLAGIRTEDIELFTADRVLHIRGVRNKPQLPEPAEQVSVHVMEIDSGRFHRRVALPDDVDTARFEAAYRHGYLWISFPSVSEKARVST